MSDESDTSSDSSSPPLGPPGGGQLTFLPVQQDNSSPSSSSSSPSSSASASPIEEIEEIEEIKEIKESEEEEEEKRDMNVWDIVYMTSSPLAYIGDGGIIALELLDVSGETEEIMSVFCGHGHGHGDSDDNNNGSSELSVCHLTATSGNLILAMTHSCRILHYSGHGFPNYLAFEDEDSIGDTHMLHDSAFEKIRLQNRKLQFVFTSACHSESVGLSFVAAGVPHVVSIDTKFEVSDHGAMTFTKYFYKALLCGRTIADSFNFGKQSVQFISSSAKRDFCKFKLLPIGSKHKPLHNVSLFSSFDSLPMIINKTAPFAVNNLPAAISPFIGRSIDMREIIHSFMSKKNESCRILNIYGDHGVGKSACCIMVARYLNDRKIYFPNGIYYIDSLKFIGNGNGNMTLSQMLAVIVNVDADALINNLKLFCRYALFIIDDIDELISYSKMNSIDVNKELFCVISKILLLVSEKIKFVIISKKICDGAMYENNNNSTISPKTYQLRRLSSTQSANLFAKLTAMTWRPNDIKENIDIMSILKNNPLQIHQLAKLKNQWECATLTKLVETYNFKHKLERKHKLQQNNSNSHNQQNNNNNRQQLIDSHICNVSAQQVWRKAHAMLVCHYYKIFEIFKSDFSEFTFSRRSLQENNLIECFRGLGMKNDLTISIQTFDAIYSWFNGLTRLVQTLSTYYNCLNPLVIHGFVSRSEAQQMLSAQSVVCGTFLIRFRYKEAKSIAISYKQSAKKVSNLKCDLSPTNDGTFICGQKLLPLPQFILTFPPLKYLYNKESAILIPKEKIFLQQQQPSFNNTSSYHSHPHKNKNQNNQKNPQLMASYHAKSYGPPSSKTKTQKSYY